MFAFQIDGESFQASYSEIYACYIADKDVFADDDAGEYDCEGVLIDDGGCQEFSGFVIHQFTRRKCYFSPIFDEGDEGEDSEEGFESESSDDDEYWDEYDSGYYDSNVSEVGLQRSNSDLMEELTGSRFGNWDNSP